MFISPCLLGFSVCLVFQEKVESLKSECDRLRDRARLCEDALQRDSDYKVQVNIRTNFYLDEFKYLTDTVAQLVEHPHCDQEVAGSILGRIVPRTLKMVLATLSLGIM